MKPYIPFVREKTASVETLGEFNVIDRDQTCEWLRIYGDAHSGFFDDEYAQCKYLFDVCTEKAKDFLAVYNRNFDEFK